MKRYIWFPAADQFIPADKCVVVEFEEPVSGDLESRAYENGVHEVEPGRRLPDKELDKLRGY